MDKKESISERKRTWGPIILFGASVALLGASLRFPNTAPGMGVVMMTLGPIIMIWGYTNIFKKKN